jgi:hypothetical protein
MPWETIKPSVLGGDWVGDDALIWSLEIDPIHCCQLGLDLSGQSSWKKLKKFGHYRKYCVKQLFKHLLYNESKRKFNIIPHFLLIPQENF